ncbi:MAG: ATP-binding protein [Firmicutes bacterium]|nr:ATP-binding protein [Bacillota bacterium]
MRIGITGAPGTGKKNLARALAEELKLPLLLIDAQETLSFLNTDVDEVNKRKLLAADLEIRMLQKQILAEESHGSFVSNRTGLDYMAHWRAYGLPEDNEVSRDFMRRCLEREYDLVVYVPYYGKEEKYVLIDSVIVSWLGGPFCKYSFVAVRGDLKRDVGLVKKALVAEGRFFGWTRLT